jgi:hypothetical protein
MLSVTLSRRINADELISIFSRNVQALVYSKTHVSGNVEVLNLAGTAFFLRTTDTIGFVLFSFYNGAEQKIDFGRIGGGSGLLNIRWGAGNKVEEKILREIRQAAENIGAMVS